MMDPKDRKIYSNLVKDISEAAPPQAWPLGPLLLASTYTTTKQGRACTCNLCAGSEAFHKFISAIEPTHTLNGK